VSPFEPTFLVSSSTVATDIGRDCEAVINELAGTGFTIQSAVTPGGNAGAVVVYNMLRRGPH
jgi:hypothetical protein